MSEQRVTVGVIALLDPPLGNLHTDSWQEVSDRLDEIDSKLKITYGGDMVVYRHEDGPSYDAGLVIFDQNDNMFGNLQEELRQAGLFIVEGSEKMFVDNWYDGCDPPHIAMTREDAGYDKEWSDD